MVCANMAVTHKRDQLIEATLSHVPFDGWTRTALYLAADDIGMSRKEAELAFPGGQVDLILYAHGLFDRRMEEKFQEADFVNLRIRDKVSEGIKIRLMIGHKHRDAMRKAMSVLALPQNIPLGTKALFSTVDKIWYAAGDTATDWNYYSKRSLLAGVYSSTLLYWLNDKSDNFEASWAFLDRRIANVMQIPKLKAKANDVFKAALNLPFFKHRTGRDFRVK